MVVFECLYSASGNKETRCAGIGGTDVYRAICPLLLEVLPLFQSRILPLELSSVRQA